MEKKSSFNGVLYTQTGWKAFAVSCLASKVVFAFRGGCSASCNEWYRLKGSTFELGRLSWSLFLHLSLLLPCGRMEKRWTIYTHVASRYVESQSIHYCLFANLIRKSNVMNLTVRVYAFRISHLIGIIVQRK